VFTGAGDWCVVQQGLSDASGTARRYHWRGARVTSFIEEPHAAVCADAGAATFNLVAAESGTARGATVEVAALSPETTLAEIARRTHLVLPSRHRLIAAADVHPTRLHKTLLRSYERAPEDFESLLGIEGVGPRTLRALALVAELIYGARTSARDPAGFAFAHGGKDGTPFPVDRATYDQTIEVLKSAVGRARIDRSERVRALKRLAGFAAHGVRPGRHQPEPRRPQPLPDHIQPRQQSFAF
jgi:hypothetical protein